MGTFHDCRHQMTRTAASAPSALVTGASGQDGSLLVERLALEGFRVHAVVRTSATPRAVSLGRLDGVELHEADIRDGDRIAEIVDTVQPTELYNLAGLSSVSDSFADPRLAWLTNAAAVADLLEVVRRSSPSTRMYQASSSEMFGWVPGGAVKHDEEAPLLPQSPYASAKAAAHLLCSTYRRAYGLRISCGILFNHESRLRGPSFLTRKVTDHVRALHVRTSPMTGEPLTAGNLMARRDWGFAPDYVDGMCRILRQVAVRADVHGGPAGPDVAAAYRDYVLGTGQTHAVWELIDRAFKLGGFELEWEMSDRDVATWWARFRGTDVPAVRVDPKLLRPNDPLVIEADASRAREELGWAPGVGLDRFLEDMLGDALAPA
jgi:GDPmannose 4,6-dehydratase